VVNDQLRKAANAKRHRCYTKCHSVDHRSPEALRCRRMPEDIETCHGGMHLVDKAGANGGNATDRRHPGGRTAQQHESCTLPRRVRHAASDFVQQSNSFFNRHSSNSAADDGIVRPTTLLTPVARTPDHGSRDAGMHHVDSFRFHATADERVAHGVGDGNETRYAPAVLDAPTGHEHDASGDDERDVSPANQGGDGNRVGAGVVCVNEIGAEGLQSTRDFPCGAEVPSSGCKHAGYREAGGTCPSEERRLRGRDDNRFVTCVSLGPGQEVYVSLPAPPRLPRIDVQYSQRHSGKLQHGCVGATRNIGSTSGCNQYHNRVVT
jgi:hypothetical protein